jgi:hypothetical protein
MAAAQTHVRPAHTNASPREPWRSSAQCSKPTSGSCNRNNLILVGRGSAKPGFAFRLEAMGSEPEEKFPMEQHSAGASFHRCLVHCPGRFAGPRCPMNPVQEIAPDRATDVRPEGAADVRSATCWNLEHSYAQLPPRFFTRVQPTPVSEPKLVLLNVALAEELGLAESRFSLQSPGPFHPSY